MALPPLRVESALLRRRSGKRRCGVTRGTRFVLFIAVVSCLAVLILMLPKWIDQLWLIGSVAMVAGIALAGTKDPWR